jgi:dihydroxyacetone kinase
LVNDSLEAATYINPAVSFDAENRIIYRNDNSNSNNVFLLSGGGSGHEPSFSGFVGKGFLDASVAGTIFASPSTEQIRKAITLYAKGRDVLVIIMNYTGDVLNFGLAVEKAKASGANLKMVVVGDDVGVGRAKGGKVGRRGIAGTIIVQKIAGAVAAAGASLKEVADIAEFVAGNIVSVGASLGHVHVPGSNTTQQTLADDEVEVGMGIHNEPGAGTAKLDPAVLVDTLLDQLLDPEDEDRHFIDLYPAQKVVLLVNNLGGVSSLEMGALIMLILRKLRINYSIEPCRVISGALMTSLNGEAFSISLLKVESKKSESGFDILNYLDAVTDAPAWPAVGRPLIWGSGGGDETPKASSVSGDSSESGRSSLMIDPELSSRAIKSACNRLIKAEPLVTEYDTLLGDGDCGVGLKRGALAVLKVLEDDSILDDALALVSAITESVESSMDGTSGALYGIFLNAMVSELREKDAEIGRPSSPNWEVNSGTALWSSVLFKALETLERYTVAKVGDRTLMDTLFPFIDTFHEWPNFKKAVDAGVEGCRKTQGMQPKLGRSVYVGGDAYQKAPDAGAYGLSEFLQGFEEGLRS